MVNTVNYSSDAFLGDSLVETQYDRFLRMQLRAPGVMSQFVTVHPVQPSAPGNAIILKRYNDLAAATTTLTETADVDSVAVPATTDVTVTLLEKGNVVTRSEKLDLTALSSVDPAIADIVSQNVIDTRESLIMTSAIAATNKTFAGASGAVDTAATATTDIASTDIIGDAQVRYSVTKLRSRNAVPVRDEAFVGLLHPFTAHDLRKSTGAGTWRQVHEYSAPGGIWKGETGMYEGTSFIETNRVYSTTDGATSANVYRNLFFGQEALAEAVANPYQVVVGPVVDRLKRFQHIGWKALVGYAIYREQAIQALYTSSSLG